MITIISLGYAGRLGNQMFQYATLMSLSQKTGFDPVIPLKNKNIKNDGAYDYFNKSWIKYKFLLDEVFYIKIPLVKDEMIKLKYFYKEPYFHYDENLFKIKDNTGIEGYFQSYKYFDDIKDIIKNEFSFKEEIFSKSYEKINLIKDGYDELVSVHVRRGDYLGNQKSFPLCTIEYYQNAINKFNDKNYRFVIFSDDIDWCKNVFGEDDSLYYSENNGPYIDLCMMSMCDNFIIANSSFSWWGAYLGNNINKKVIAPLLWFGPSAGHNTKDLIPKEWTLI